MPTRLAHDDEGFEDGFRALLAARASATDVRDQVAAIIAEVRKRGDEAVADHTSRFDRFAVEPDELRIATDEIDAAADAIDGDLAEALRLARDRIEAHHRRQLPADDRYSDGLGVELASRWTPIGAVGLYVPGGTAAYPSSVLMNAVPAKIAGVGRIVMVVPTPDGRANPLVLAAARLAGIDEIYRIGGAQAVAALAYGTATVAPVDKIVGPGNAYVAEAKRQVFGTVGIDSIAGPSEVLIIGDGSANPEWIAADLLAQAEHDTAAQAVLITDSTELADAVATAVEGQLKNLARSEIAGASWRDHGAIIVAPLSRAAEFANRIAAEHVELHLADPDAVLETIVNAGAIFVGPHTPEAIGDYVGGSNHVLPTGRAARFSSGLSVLDFMKRTSILRCGADQLNALGPSAITLAEAEGLGAHARSVAIRLNRS